MNPKIIKILEELAHNSFLAEDYYSRDYCKYCYVEYGNYDKFGHYKKSVQDNHKEDCLYRMAVEVLESIETQKEPRMGMIDCSFCGKDCRTCLATVTGGEFSGKTVGVMAQYKDGYCICDMGCDREEKSEMEIIHIKYLQLWTPVKSVFVGDDGRVTIEPLED